MTLRGVGVTLRGVAVTLRGVGVTQRGVGATLWGVRPLPRSLLSLENQCAASMETVP